MNNTTEALNATNQTAWQIKDIGDIQGIFAFLQNIVSGMLESWGYMPENIYFKLLIVIGGVLLLYQLFVSGSSKAGNLFKWVLMAFLVVVILIALNII